VTATYNYWIVALSFAIAWLAAYRAIALARQLFTCVDDEVTPRILNGAIMLGTGIWGMHFTGMLAFHLPIAITYDLIITLGSGLIAVLASAFSLWRVRVFAQGHGTHWSAALLIGGGIAAMHYTGMAAMKMSPPIDYDPWIVALSILIAVSASGIGFKLLTAPQLHSIGFGYKKLGATTLIAIAITGMHYTGMMAAGFRPDSVCLVDPNAITPNLLLGLVLILSLLAILMSYLLVPAHPQEHAKRPLLLDTVNNALPIAVLLILSAVSLGIFIKIWDESVAQKKDEFEQVVQTITTQTQTQIIRHVDVLHAFEAFYASSREVEADEFRSFASGLQLDSAQNVLHGGHILGLLRPQRPLHEGPRTTCLAQAPSGVYQEGLTPLAYLPRNSARVGDLQPPVLTWDKNLHQALRDAQTSNQTTLVQIPPIAHAGGSPIDTLLLHPIYQTGKAQHTVEQRCANLLGWLYLGVNLKDLLLLGQGKNSLDIAIYDGKIVSDSNLIWRTNLIPADVARNKAERNLFKETRQIVVADHEWTLVFNTWAYFSTTKHSGWSQLLFLVSLISALFMALLVWLLNRLRLRALLATAKVTQELIANEKLMQMVTVQNTQLAVAAQMKDQFIATMSHELRTPLNAIIGFSDLLSHANKSPLNETQQKHLHYIHTNGQHLLSLINDTLDLAKIDAGKMDLDLEPMDAYQLCADFLASVPGLTTDKPLHLTLKADKGLGILWMDVRKAQQITYNLLSNAIKFSPAHGSITLRVKRVSVSLVGRHLNTRPALLFPFTDSIFDEFLELSVEDGGIGIAATDFPRLFKPFSQISGRLSRHYTGTGLGLALVKNLVEMQGGTLAVSSVEGHGSRFTVWIPWRTSAPPPPPQNIELAPHLR